MIAVQTALVRSLYAAAGAIRTWSSAVLLVTVLSPIYACARHDEPPSEEQGSQNPIAQRTCRVREVDSVWRPGDPLGDAEWTGEFLLTLVATSGANQDSVASGHLALRPMPHAQQVEGSPITPIYGWTDVDLSRLATLTIADPLASRDPTRPGVLLVYNTVNRSIVLLLGGSQSQDAGVVLFVGYADSSGFSGQWRDGGLRLPIESGHFCAERER